MNKSEAADMKREIKAIQKRFMQIKDSEEPEHKKEVQNLMRCHENLRELLNDYGYW